jgi:uncharacterized RDD family membrane protein YckC
VNPSPPTKVLGRRYLAHLIDALVRIAAVVVPFVLLAERRTVDAVDPTIADRYDQVDTFAVGALRAIKVDDRLFLFERKELVIVAAVAVGVTLFFDVIVQGRAGWTIGKGLTGLRTVNRSGDRPGIFRALVRTVLFVIDLIPSYLLPLVGGLIIFASDTNRRLGDLVAGTYVVDKGAWGEDPRGEEEELDWDRTDLESHPGHVTTLAAGEAIRVGDAPPAEDEPESADEPVSEPTPEPAAAGAASRPAYQPQWDPARKAYLQWDPRREAWLQFDDDSQQWRPIG